MMPIPNPPPPSVPARIILRLALRNLRRQFLRNALTSSSVILGGSLLIFAFSIGDGTHEEWIHAGVRNSGTGHVTIERPEFRLSRKIEDRLPASVRAETALVLEAPEIAAQVVAVSPRLSINGLASSSTGARPAQIIAVDPVAEVAFSQLDDQVIEGRYLKPDDRIAAYVGVGLVESLDLRLGSRFVVQAQDVEREITGQLLRVVGIFRSGGPDTDQRVVHIPFATGAEWLGSDRDVTNVAVVVPDITAVSGVTARLKEALAGPITRGEVQVIEWRESNPALASAVAIDDFGNYVFFGIFFVIIAVFVVNTVLMSVLQRHREFGVLHALGLTPTQVGSVVLVEGLTLTAGSGLIGVILGLSITWWFFGNGLDFTVLMGEEMTFAGVAINPVIVPIFRVARLAQVATFLTLLGVGASIYPAVRAARIDAAEAMKCER